MLSITLHSIQTSASAFSQAMRVKAIITNDGKAVFLVSTNYPNPFTIGKEKCL